MSAASVNQDGLLMIPDELIRRWAGLAFGVGDRLAAGPLIEELQQACRLLLAERGQREQQLRAALEGQAGYRQGVERLHSQVERTVEQADAFDLERAYVARCYVELLEALDQLHARWMEHPVRSADQHSLLGQLMDDLVELKMRAEQAAAHAAHRLD